MNKIKSYISNISVLFIDDEDGVRESYERLLGMWAKKVYTASNGKKGLEVYKKQKPDIIVTDIKMPVMSGLEMIGEIKKIDPEVPIIITTAHQDPELLLEAIEYQVDAYIVKPIPKKEFKKRLENISKVLVIEKELKNIQELNKLYLNASSAFMIALDRDANITMINKTASEMLGFTEKEILGKNWFEIGVLPPLSIKEGKTIFSKFISGDCESDQQTHQGGILSKDGKSFVLTWSTSLLREDDEIVGVLGSALDTTELYNTQRELKKQTYIDALTNTYNRKYYNLKISESLSLYERNQTPFTVLMYDIDDFKKINDSYGHLAGDDILTEMSQLIQSNIRKSDYLFRVGGEEFVIIFADTHLKQAKIVAEKIRKSVEESLENLKNETITISIGVTQVQKSDNADDIYKRVDDLLYISKKNGKNMVSF